MSTSPARSKRQGREFQDEGRAGAKVPRCVRLWGTSEMVGAGAQGARKRRGREEVERGQGLEGHAGDVNLSTTGWQGNDPV